MLKFARRVIRFVARGEEGASFIEYGLLLVVVVLAVGAAGITLRDDIVTFLNNIGAEVAGASVPNIP